MKTMRQPQKSSKECSEYPWWDPSNLVSPLMIHIILAVWQASSSIIRSSYSTQKQSAIASGH